ncbi:diphosphomevalonate decarboxylase [Rhodohalobacter halophilus]|uniref:diphosphomevalonate decarboxylase n=1 Tax=Rhodohalobacter halophilus TaxID=1812810 RepID=UPI000A4F6BD4|nr:diphosphomevalonate decarboxylase [Rhodohalobacter halophilus]
MNSKRKRIIADFTYNPVTAKAHANIALIKYWGKRSVDLNLPAVGSISLTLDALQTTTTLQFDDHLENDILQLDHRIVAGEPLERVSTFLDLAAGTIKRPRAKISTSNNFPTGAGLASSASGFAALAIAANQGMNLQLTDKELSKLARQGSGSAARSIYGGFAEMRCGSSLNDDSDDFAQGLYNDSYWDLRLLIAVTSANKKEIGSTEGMVRTAKTSPFYRGWVESQNEDLDEMRRSISNKDFEKVGELTEHSCFKMHGLAMSARSPILYWNAATTKMIHTIWNLRKKGIAAYVTMDAGPQVKVLCLPGRAELVKQAMLSVEGVKQIIEAKPGPGATIVSDDQQTVKNN